MIWAKDKSRLGKLPYIPEATVVLTKEDTDFSYYIIIINNN